MEKITLSNLINVMSMADLVAISIGTLRIGSG